MTDLDQIPACNIPTVNTTGSMEYFKEDLGWKGDQRWRLRSSWLRIKHDDVKTEGM